MFAALTDIGYNDDKAGSEVGGKPIYDLCKLTSYSYCSTFIFLVSLLNKTSICKKWILNVIFQDNACASEDGHPKGHRHSLDPGVSSPPKKHSAGLSQTPSYKQKKRVRRARDLKQHCFNSTASFSAKIYIFCVQPLVNILCLRGEILQNKGIPETQPLEGLSRENLETFAIFCQHFTGGRAGGHRSPSSSSSSPWF